MCAVGQIVGVWLRWVVLESADSFAYLLIPQALIASFQPYFCNGVSKLATVWFGDEERALATTIGSLATPIGCILGMVLGPFFVSENDKEDHIGGKSNIENYLSICAAVATGLTIPLIIFYKRAARKFSKLLCQEHD